MFITMIPVYSTSHIIHSFLRMHIRLLLSFLFIVLTLCSGYAQDDITANRKSDCCFDFTVTNNSPIPDRVNEIVFKVVTPGVTIISNGRAPNGWTVTHGTEYAASFVGRGVQNGNSQSGFILCFDSPPSTFELKWTTYETGNLRSTGVLRLVCREGCDSIVVVNIDQCCYEWSVTNKNIALSPIDGFELKITTPGINWGSVTPPAGWTSSITGQTLTFRTTTPLAPGITATGFMTCFDVSTGLHNVSLDWRTLFDTATVCSDRKEMQCRRPIIKDSLAAIENPTGSCCLTMELFNKNSQNSPLNELRFFVLTSGASVAGTPTSAWTLQNLNAVSFSFVGAGAPLNPGNSLAGFNACFQHQAGNSGPILVRWESRYNGLLISEDTISIDCQGPPVRCDDVLVTQRPNTSTACCYSLAVANLHNLNPSDVNGFRLRMLTSNSRFTGVLLPPWPATTNTDTLLVFESPGPMLANGDTLRGINICVEPPLGFSGTIRVTWETLLNSTVICTDTLSLGCSINFTPRCDSLIQRKVKDCEYDFGFANKRQPAMPVDVFSLRLLTPSSSFALSTAPGGWAFQLQTTQRLVFQATGAPVNPGSSKTGFLFTLNPPPGSGAVLIEWCTNPGASPSCCDTILIQCSLPVETRCDSLLLQQLPDTCAFDFGFVNLHQPSTPVNDFRIVALHPGVIVKRAEAPAGWVIDSQGSSHVLFRNASGSVPYNGTKTGFKIWFASSTTTFDVQWCTSLNGQIICCETKSLRCEIEQARCDSLLIQPGQTGCSFDLGFANTHVPTTHVNEFRVFARSQGAIIESVIAPSGWVIALQTPTTVSFLDTLDGLPSGQRKEGFIVRFSPPSSGSEIQFRWCTLFNDSVLCCEDARVECQDLQIQCDSLSTISDTNRACCFEMRVHNQHLPASNITSMHIDVLTTGVTLFLSSVESPQGWTSSPTPRSVFWTTTTNALVPASSISGFKVCYDNSAINHQDFQVLWRTLDSSGIICSDTLQIGCDETLDAVRSITTETALEQNFPNPFSSYTVVPFSLASRTHVKLVVFNVLGQIVRTLKNEVVAPGRYEVPLELSSLPSGTYIIRLYAHAKVYSRRIVSVQQ